MRPNPAILMVLLTKYMYFGKMNNLRKWLYLPGCLCLVMLGFLGASLLDIGISVIYSRFYTSWAFLACYVVAGIITGSLGYVMGMDWAPPHSGFAHRAVHITLIGGGLLFLLLFAKLEGGGYEAAFRCYGSGVIGGALLFWKYKPRS